MFFEKAIAGKNGFWRYFVTVVIVIIATEILGGLPLLLVYLAKTIQNGAVLSSSNPMDFSAIGLNPNIGLLLIIFSFLVGLVTLWVCIRLIHRKRIMQVITGCEKFRYRHMLIGAGLWIAFLSVSLITHILLEGDNYTWSFQPSLFIQLVIVAVLFLPIQTSFEELLFRGYLMQGFGLLCKNRWMPLLITSLAFGLLHAYNPEVKAYGFWISMPQYIGWGLFLGLLVVLDDGLEIPLGIHAANNIFLSVFVTNDNSALQTPALFTVDHINPVSDLAEFAGSILLFFLIAQLVFHWKSWSTLFKRLYFSKS